MKRLLFLSLLLLSLLILLITGSCGDGVPETLIPPTVSVQTLVNVSTPTWTWNSPSGTETFRYQLNSKSSERTTMQETSYTPGQALYGDAHTLYVQGQITDGLWTASGSATVEIDTSLS
jgi:hypothetical protein